MNTSPNSTILRSAILALVLPQHAVSFATPRLQCRATTSSPTGPSNTRRQVARPHRPVVVLHTSPLSLDTIMENPDSFPNTSRILRAISRDNSAGDYKEFLTVLSEEWMRYSIDDSGAIAGSEGKSRPIGASSFTIATAVGTASGYAAMQAEDYLHHYQWAQDYPMDSYGEQQFASVESSGYGDHVSAVAFGGYEPHPYISRNYHYGESSPNVLRDLARSLPPPQHYSDGMAATTHYDGFAPYYDGSLHYVAGGPSGMEAAVATVDSLPTTIQAATSDVTNFLSSQLSDVTYSQSFAQVDTASKRFSVPQLPTLPTLDSAPSANAAVAKVKEFASHSTESINHALAGAKEAGSSQLSHLFGSMDHSLEGWPEKVANVGSSSVESMGRVIGENVKIPSLDISKMPSLDMSKIKMPSIPSVPSVDVSKMKMPSISSFSGVKSGVVPTDSLGSSAVPSHFNFADTSLSEIGNSIFGSIKFLGGLIFQFFDWVIGAVVGTNLSQILGSVQTSIATLIDNASSSVVNTINSLGEMTLKEVLQAFLTLLLVVTDIILKVTNAIVYLISGKDAGDWALQANSAVHTYGDQLLAQAGQTYQDVTHKSLGELATSIGDYSHHVGEELLAVMSGVSTQSGVGGILSGVGGDVSYLSAENLDTIASAVQTALTL